MIFIVITNDTKVAELSSESFSIPMAKLEEAKISILRAIELQANYYDAYFNLSLIELLTGDYNAGLENYEFRWKKRKIRKY